jgi:glycosyltransferase involved in cell wall biosynthesis/folate-dependent phosphoribosylglycinamide formyltransferase PurN
MSTVLGRPIRVVYFGGPYLQPGALRFAAMLDAHPDVQIVLGLCEAEGAGLRMRWRNLWRRRGLAAIPVFLLELVVEGWRFVRHPRASVEMRRRARRAMSRFVTVPDMHAAEVLERVRAVAPDLGVIYGAPILKQELFEIPPLGTLGIHHGRVPTYRGKKTTFWEMYHGEPAAGVTIQRINPGIDTGDIVLSGDVPIARKSYSRVWQEVEDLGCRLYLDAVLAIRNGSARFTPQVRSAFRTPLFRQPKIGDILDFWRRRLLGGSAPPVPEPRAVAAKARPLRVLILTETFRPEIGGGERQAAVLGQGLLARGHQVLLLTRRSRPGLPTDEQIDGLRVVRVGPTGRSRLSKWVLLLTTPWALRSLRGQYDCVLVSGYRILALPALAAARRAGVPVVLKADSLGEFSGAYFRAGLASLGLSPDFGIVRRALAWRNRALGDADAFVAIATEIHAELVAHGIPPEHIRRIPNGVDAQRFRPATAEERVALRGKLGLPAGPIVVYTGRLVSYKGLRTLLDAWRMLATERTTGTLVLVGEGSGDMHDCETDLRATVARHRLESQVRFAGAVHNVEDYLRAADIFAFPTEQEAFGLSLVEAMACGLPAVTTRVGGLADYVQNGENASVVPLRDAQALANAIRHLLDSPALAARLGAAARATAVGQFGEQAVAVAYEGLMRELIDRRRTAVKSP